MLTHLRPAIVMIVLFTLLTGVAYPYAIAGIASLVFPGQASGSLVMKDGKPVGSALIGQTFASPGYFHGRPSAAGKDGYDGSASSGSNLGPTSKALSDRVTGDVAKLRADGATGPVPGDLVTTSASGLDPDISPAAATYQIDRVAKARNLAPARLVDLVNQQTQGRSLGIFGEPRVNVLALNLALDQLAGSAPPAAGAPVSSNP